jgi:hypothetical protein
VNDTHVSNEVLSIFADNHELTFPELLVIRDLIVVGFSLSDFVDTCVTIERETKSLEFFSVDGFERKVELVAGNLVCYAFERLAFEAGLLEVVLVSKFEHLHGAEVTVT